tara:strand:- start:74 stop:478 length:405 start_codon:yes stop_codon:yes gene_type:complete
MDKTTKAFVIAACLVVIPGMAITGVVVVSPVLRSPLRCFAGHIQSKFGKDPGSGVTSMSYGAFRTDVKEQKIARVLLSPARGTAQVVSTDGRRFLVRLAPDKNLLKLLTDNNVDVAVQPGRAGPVIDDACNFLF